MVIGTFDILIGKNWKSNFQRYWNGLYFRNSTIQNQIESF